MLFVIGGGFFFVGICLLMFPRQIRKYDQRLTRYIKDEDGYRIALAILGVMFVVSAILAIVMGFFLPETAYHK